MITTRSAKRRAPGGRVHAAIDLRAGTGRVMIGVWKDDVLRVREVRRFPITYAENDGLLRWDVRSAFGETLIGLSEVEAICHRIGATFAGIGVHGWSSDFAPVSDGSVDLDDVRHQRGAGVPRGGHPGFASGGAERYARTGVADDAGTASQQLAARRDAGSHPAASPLFIADLWVHLLTGAVVTETTLASTSQLFDLHRGDWSSAVLSGVDPSGLPPVSTGGSPIGHTLPDVTERIGATAPIPILVVPAWESAAALTLAPAASSGDLATGVVVSGAWSSAGLCVTEPVTTDAARDGQFSTTRGARGHLMLRSLSGMWLLQESVRSWRSAGLDVGILPLVLAAANAEGDDRVIDLNDPRLLDAGDTTDVLADLAEEAGRVRPTTPTQVVRLILESLADSYVGAIDEAAALADVVVAETRILGDGSRNRLLCQLTADRSGRRVLSGPADPAPLGNLAAQLVEAGECATVDDAISRAEFSRSGPVEYRPRETVVSR